MLPHKQIQLRLQQAVREVLPDADSSRQSGATADVSGVLVLPCPDPKFGDYQSNALMSLAKGRRLNPRQLASEVVARLDVGQWCEKVEIAGAGFLNFRLKNAALAEALQAAARGEHLFFETVAHPRTVVVDFSSPNAAKPMHVGHIRSTILGDSLARTLRLLGHRVISDNHIGDWGTQFGKLLVGWKREAAKGEIAFGDRLRADPIGEMERLYKLVNAESEADEKVLEQARQELVKLQSGDAENMELWRTMISLSQSQFNSVYADLRVQFDHTHGESFYQERLKPLVDELLANGIARESEGAVAIFFDDIPQLKGQPALIRKSDGGFNYTTTDLATLDYRLKTWQPDEIIYVTDGRQQLHFQQIFAAFRKWRPEARVKLAHVWFGSILGEDGKPFKTRSGDTVKLVDLIDEAEARAYKIISEKNPELPEPQRHKIAFEVGIGAMKYADLLPNRQSDYVFSWDKMLALNGNTAVYLMYAYARIRSIFRKAGGTSDIGHRISNIELVAAEEIALAKHLLNFGLALEAVAEEYRPNLLCNYLYDLAGHFMRFFENCPVLKANEPERGTRLLLCGLTGRILKQGLEVLGIETPEQM